MTAVAARSAPSTAMLPLDRLRAHPRNVRVSLGDLRDLAASIREQGIVVPLMVERHGDYFRVLHGHRRAAAAKQAGLRRAPCVVVDHHDDADAIALMLVENDQRLGLTPTEKRRAVQALHREFGWPMRQVAERVGVSEATAYRWAKGEEDLSLTPSRPGQAKPPHVKPAAVHDLLSRWQGRAPEPLLREVQAWIGDWRPKTQEPMS